MPKLFVNCKVLSTRGIILGWESPFLVRGFAASSGNWLQGSVIWRESVWGLFSVCGSSVPRHSWGSTWAPGIHSQALRPRLEDRQEDTG